MFRRHKWLATTIWDNIWVEHLHPHRKFCWTQQHSCIYKLHSQSISIFSPKIKSPSIWSIPFPHKSILPFLLSVLEACFWLSLSLQNNTTTTTSKMLLINIDHFIFTVILISWLICATHLTSTFYWWLKCKWESFIHLLNCQIFSACCEVMCGGVCSIVYTQKTHKNCCHRIFIFGCTDRQ